MAKYICKSPVCEGSMDPKAGQFFDKGDEYKGSNGEALFAAGVLLLADSKEAKRLVEDLAELTPTHVDQALPPAALAAKAAKGK